MHYKQNYLLLLCMACPVY